MIIVEEYDYDIMLEAEGFPEEPQMDEVYTMKNGHLVKLEVPDDD